MNAGFGSRFTCCFSIIEKFPTSNTSRRLLWAIVGTIVTTEALHTGSPPPCCEIICSICDVTARPDPTPVTFEYEFTFEAYNKQRKNTCTYKMRECMIHLNTLDKKSTIFSCRQIQTPGWGNTTITEDLSWTTHINTTTHQQLTKSLCSSDVTPNTANRN